MKRLWRFTPAEKDAYIQRRVERNNEYQTLSTALINRPEKTLLQRQIISFKGKKPKPVTLPTISFMKSDAGS